MSRNATARSIIVPPPVNGWNTRDPISQMDPLYAVELENMFPGDGVVSLRNGFRYHSKSIGSSTVFSLASLEYGTVSKLIAVSSTGVVYDATTASAAATDISGGVTFATDYCMIRKFRDRLFIKPLISNNDVYHYTGTGNIALSAFTGPDTGAGADDKALYTFGSYRSRLYFAQADVPSLWYGGVDAITGALTEFPLRAVLTKPFVNFAYVGGLTYQGQAAIDDALCVISDSGEGLLYGGDYPGSATWSLIARFEIPPPMSVWGFANIGSNLVALTQQGIVSIQDAISGQSSSVGGYKTLSDAIQSQFVSAFSSSSPPFSLNFPIYLNYYPRGQMLVAGTGSGGSTQHYVMNTTTGAWCKFSQSCTAFSWAMWKSNLYFSTSDGRVMKFDTGYFDEDPASEGNATSRTVVCRPAYNYFGDPSSVKRIGMVQPYIYQSEGLSLTIGADMDFADTTPTTTVTDTSDTAYKLWTPVIPMVGVGSACSMRIEQTVTTKRISLQAMKITYESGGAY